MCQWNITPPPSQKVPLWLTSLPHFTTLANFLNSFHKTNLPPDKYKRRNTYELVVLTSEMLLQINGNLFVFLVLKLVHNCSLAELKQSAEECQNKLQLVVLICRCSGLITLHVISGQWILRLAKICEVNFPPRSDWCPPPHSQWWLSSTGRGPPRWCRNRWGRSDETLHQGWTSHIPDDNDDHWSINYL